MILVGLGALALAGCKSIPPPTPLAQLTPQQAEGHAVFQTQCGICHADRTNDLLHGPALRSIFKKDYLPSGAPANDDMVIGTILRGRNMMPPMAGRLDQQDLDDLMAYLHTI